MEKLTIKKSEMVVGFNTATSYIKKVGKNKNKLSYACDRTMNSSLNKEILANYNKDITKIQDRSNEKFMDVKIECASLDKDNNILQDEKGEFKFTKENYKKVYKAKIEVDRELNKEIEVLLKESVEIEIFKCRELPSVLEEDINIIDALELFIHKEKEIDNK